MQQDPGRFIYQVFYQSDEAVKLYEQDIEHTILCIMRGVNDDPVTPADREFQNRLYGLGKSKNPPPPSDQKTPRSKMHTEQDLAIYVEEFKRCGFLNPMRWYRNIERNWKWNLRIKDKHVTMPSLMVTAEEDYILTPSMTKGMDKWCDDLELVHVKKANHWLLQENPVECANILVSWLQRKIGPMLKLAEKPVGTSAL